MNRVRFLITCLILLLPLSIASVALAAPPAQTATPSPPAGPPRYLYGDYRVRSSVPFVWIRGNPSSSSAVLDTIITGGRVTGIAVEGADGNMAWDGVQWWAYVTTFRINGWVEVTSLEPLIVSTPAPTLTPAVVNGAQPWKANNVVRVRSGVPFAWFRSFPDAAALNIGEVQPGTRLIILTATPQYDGKQWWWQVQDASGFNVGFMEQGLLEFVRSRPNFTVSPVPASHWVSGYIVRVKRSVPFVWIRQTPGSSASILETIRSGTELQLVGGVHEDSVQLWREVSIAGMSGWVEAQSLEFVRLSVGEQR